MVIEALLIITCVNVIDPPSLLINTISMIIDPVLMVRYLILEIIDI